MGVYTKFQGYCYNTEYLQTKHTLIMHCKDIFLTALLLKNLYVCLSVCLSVLIKVCIYFSRCIHLNETYCLHKLLTINIGNVVNFASYYFYPRGQTNVVTISIYFNPPLISRPTCSPPVPPFHIPSFL